MAPANPTSRALLAALGLLLLGRAAPAAPPSYSGGRHGKASYSHDGKLRWAVGTQNVQVVRSAPDNPSLTDGSDTIYRHHQMIAHWGGRFWVTHDGSGTRVSWSSDGLSWSQADSATLFTGCNHHRMGFYVASSGRLLALHWTGTQKGGQGTRVVREILGPGSFGPVYGIKDNYKGPAPNKSFPSYTTALGGGFKAACAELLASGPYRQQWQEEDQDPTFYAVSSNDGRDEWKAFSWYRLPDQRIAGFWKGIYTTVSSGPAWVDGQVPKPVQDTTFRCNTGAKTWSERTEDGRYAFVGCANDADDRRRWPLAVTTATDGLSFKTPYLVVAGDIPPARYENAQGDDKNAGPQYVRGISPGNGDPPGSDLWLTYSMNKEDIWVAAVPLPISGTVTSDVHDDFQAHIPGRRVEGWNTYSPQWAPVSVVADGANRLLRLEDRDPVDYASVTRVFPETGLARLSFRVRAHQSGASSAPLEVDVVGYNGDRAVAIALDPAAGQITARVGAASRAVAAYSPSSWIAIELRVFGEARRFSLRVNGAKVLGGAASPESSPTVERVVFRTGAFRLRDFTRRPTDDPWLTTRIPGADVMSSASTFDIDDVALQRDTALIASIDQVSSGRAYRTGVAGEGARVYIDRDYAIQSLPAELAGLEMIQTSNEDDGVSVPDHLRFTLSADATVYLAMETSGGGALPAWASGWTDSGMEIQVPSAGTFRVHRQPFPKGQVTLGGNDRAATGAVSSYFVLAAPVPGAGADAGTAPTDAGAPPDAGLGVDAGAPGGSAGPAEPTDGGCSVTRTRARGTPFAPLFALAALLGLWARGRRAWSPSTRPTRARTCARAETWVGRGWLSQPHVLSRRRHGTAIAHRDRHDSTRHIPGAADVRC